MFKPKYVVGILVHENVNILSERISPLCGPDKLTPAPGHQAVIYQKETAGPSLRNSL